LAREKYQHSAESEIAVPLNDITIRNAKPRRKAFKLSDGGSLFLLVQPTGGKLWRLAYRINGKQKSLSFGAYPAVSLADARSKRDSAKASLKDGSDPSVLRKIEKQARGNTFKVVANELVQKMELEGRANATLVKTRWLLDFAFNVIGDRPIAKISAPELLAVLRKVEKRGTYETARRLRSTCGMVFRYAVATGRAVRDPSVDLRGALTTPTVKHRAAIIEPTGIGALLRAIESFDGHKTTRAALRLAALFFVRPGELRHAEWVEFDFDKAEWIIPAEKMKMRRPHRVPLSRQAIVRLKELQTMTGQGRLLFPSVRSVLKPLSENTLNAALRRLGYGPDDMTAHGFRTMAATRLNEMCRWNADAIERQLAHQEPNAVRHAYTHGAEYWLERVSMMQAWADYLDELQDAGKIIPLHRDQI
jgi:integrase